MQTAFLGRLVARFVARTLRPVHSLPASCLRGLIASVAVSLSVLPLRAESTAPGVPAEPVPASLVLLWHHQAQFAGYYMAKEKGFYRNEGLELEIRRGGPDVSSVDEVAGGRADFCVAMLPAALERRGTGVPLVLLAQVVNRSNFALVAWKHPPGLPKTEISRPADLAGRRISLWEGSLRAPYLAFLGTQGVAPEALPQYYSLSLFLHRGVDACAAMRYNEYDRLGQSGVRAEDIVVFDLWRYGVVMPEDGLYAHERLWSEHPERCRAFARASLEGWRYAREHTEETLDVVMRYIDADHLPTNRPHMRWMLGEILRSIFPEDRDPWRFGQLTPSAFEQTAALVELGGAPRPEVTFEELVSPEARHVSP